MATEPRLTETAKTQIAATKAKTVMIHKVCMTIQMKHVEQFVNCLWCNCVVFFNCENENAYTNN